MKKALFRFLIAAIVAFVCFFGYLRFGAYLFIEKKDRVRIVNLINEAPQLPERFYELYEISNPKSLNTNLTENIIREAIGKLLEDRHYIIEQVPSYATAYIASYSYGIERVQLIYYIEAQTTQRKCLNLLTSQQDFLYSCRGIEAASQFHFQKTLVDCDDREMVTLIIMMKNPSLYNPIRRPEIVKTAVDKIMKKLEE